MLKQGKHARCEVRHRTNAANPGHACSPTARAKPLVPHAYAVEHPKSLVYWEQLLFNAAAKASHSDACCPSLGQQQTSCAAATVMVPEAGIQVPSSSGLVRSRVVKNSRGYWRIRHFQPSDLSAVADLQAGAFHDSLPVGALDKLAYTMFKAEVLDALKKKVKVLCDDSFAVMVVEGCLVGGQPDCSSADATEGCCASSSDDDTSSDCDWESAVWYGDQQAAAWPPGGLTTADCRPGVAGVVEIGVQDDVDVLQHLKKHERGTYAYITSMAVAPHLRRCGVGRALLQAAEQQAANWGQHLVALHVYESNTPGIRLYERHGMKCQAKDPAWKGLLGGRVRQLMIKEVNSRSS